jgi:uncharacterized membrane protein (UPF0127 family)
VTRVSVRREGSAEAVADRVVIADRFWQRARGLLGRRRLEDGEGLLLRPCRAVHTIGMGYPIDVAFLDAEGTIVATYPRLGPNRRTPWHGAATCALELAAGTLARTAVAPGHRLRWGT